MCILSESTRRLRPAEAELGEEGYSVLEVTVALAIFVTVLVPAIGGALRIMTKSGVRTEVKALSVAQRLMERTVHRRAFTSRSGIGPKGRWAYERSVTRREGRVDVEILIWRVRGDGPWREATDRDPLLTLRTTRLEGASGTREEGE